MEHIQGPPLKHMVHGILCCPYSTIFPTHFNLMIFAMLPLYKKKVHLLTTVKDLYASSLTCFWKEGTKSSHGFSCLLYITLI